MIGSTRGLEITWLQGGAGPVSTQVTGGFWVFDVAADSEAETIITWDGDGDPDILTLGPGFAGGPVINLITGGSGPTTAFRLPVGSMAVGTEATVTVYSNSTDFSTMTQTLPATTSLQDVLFPYSAFVPDAGGAGADFTSLVAIQLSLRSSGITAGGPATFSADFFDTVNHSPAVIEVSVDDVTELEGDPGITSFEFTVSVNSTAIEVQVTIATADGTASSASGDYTTIAPTVLTFPRGGPTSQTVTVQVAGDTSVEPNETFGLELSSPSAGAVIADGNGLGTIENDDTTELTIAGAAQAEGIGGTTAFDFAVSLSNAVEGGLTVAYTTDDGTATTTGGDYDDNDASLAFTGNPGEVQTVTVQVTGDEIVEPDEAFSVALGAISGLAAGIDPGDLSVAGSPAAGTVLDDDAGVFDAVFDAEKTASGDGTLLPGTPVDYTLLVTNLGPDDRADLPGDELVDVLPPELELLAAEADLGAAAADPGTNTVTWNGGLAAGESAVITIQAQIAEDVPLGTPVLNQATVSFDSDNDGTLNAQGLSDDPGATGPADPTTLLIGADSVLEIPVLAPWCLALLALGMAGLAVLRLRA